MVFCFFFSCSKEEKIVLDFSHFEKPKITWELDKSLDSALARTNEQYAVNVNWGCYLKTDKEQYEIGETILVTVYNEDKDGALTEYIFPSDAEFGRITESFRSYDQSDLLKEAIEKAIVSKNPMFLGEIYALHEDFYGLMFYGVPERSASEFGYDGFEKQLKVGEKMEFEIIPPKFPGYYVLYIRKFSQDDDGVVGWGLNKSACSNVFEIR